MTESPWDAYLAAAKKRYEHIEKEENYKFNLAAALAKARTALLQDDPNWPDLVKTSVTRGKNNLIYWTNKQKIAKCVDNHPDEVRDALREMWSEDDRTSGDRIRAFDDRLSESMLDIPSSAVGSRLTIASYFMMGLDAQRYPPYHAGRFRGTYTQLDYPQESAEDAGGRYEHALAFLDRMLEEARRRNMDKPATRMDAQSVVFSLVNQEHELSGPKYVRFFGPVLDALRALGGEAKRKDVIEKVKELTDITPQELNELKQDGTPKYRGDIEWARSDLVKAGLIDNKQRGLWVLTAEGWETFLDYESAVALSRDVRSSHGNTTNDEDAPAPESSEDSQVEPPHPLNTILYGPPGTGKTWHTVTRAVAIVENRNVDEVELENRNTVKSRFDKHQRGKRIEMVTFHQNTTYEDFVEGIRPVLTSSEQDSKKTSPERSDPGDIRYEMSRGVFRRIAERAEKDRNQPYVLVIDEINRGNIARIFGELITLVENSKRIGKDDEVRVTLPGSKTWFGVPANLYLLGTMNTADRSIALLDTALRRRFAFIEMMPDPSHDGVNKDIDGVDCGKVLDAINGRIAVLLDREHQIGHTYFLGIDSMAALAETFRRRIMPLLQEYFYDDWEKIRAVLNKNGFVVSRNPPKELVNAGLADADRDIYDLLPDDDRWIDPAAYRAIYETSTAAAETDDDSESQRD